MKAFPSTLLIGRLLKGYMMRNIPSTKQMNKYEVFNLLKEKRKTMNGVGTNRVKRFLGDRMMTDDVAMIYRVALDAIDACICADTFPDNDLFRRDLNKKEINILILLALYKNRHYTMTFQTDEKGNKYMCFLLPVTNMPIRFPGSGKSGEESRPNTNANHRANLKSIEKSIELVFGETLYRENPRYASVVDAKRDSYRLF